MDVAWGGARRLGEILGGRFSQRRALLVTDAGLVGAGLVAPVIASLETAGFNVLVFARVVADPPEAVLLDCVDEARWAGVHMVVGLGGGSSLNIAKLAAVLLVCDQALADIYGIDKVPRT